MPINKSELIIEKSSIEEDNEVIVLQKALSETIDQNDYLRRKMREVANENQILTEENRMKTEAIKELVCLIGIEIDDLSQDGSMSDEYSE